MSEMSEPAVSYPLHEAAADGDTDTLNRLIAEGVDPHAPNAKGSTPLMVAAYYGQAIAARHLLKRGVRVDAETPDGKTALIMAARGGHEETLRLLLAHGADPNQMVHPQPEIVTPEQREQMREFQQRLSALMPNSMHNDEDWQEPRQPEPYRIGAKTLNAAILSGHLGTVAALLEAGLPPNSSASDDRVPPLSPLRAATSFGKLDIMRLLIQSGADVNAVANDDTPPLSAAVMKGNTTAARLLLEAGADPNAGIQNPLIFSILKNDLEMIRLLLSFGANPDDASHAHVVARNKPEILALFAEHQGTDWHALIEANDLEGVRARLDAGTDIDQQNKDGKTALMIAAENGSTTIIELLLARGAQPNAFNKYQMTALTFAVRKGQEDAVRLLLAHGADVNATNQWGQTALFAALTDERQSIRALLIGAGATVGIVEAASLGDAAAVTAFLAGGVSADQTNSAGMTALMAAAQRGHTDLAILLHERGADIASQDRLDNNAFHYAVQNACGTGDTPLIVLFLDWGADINAPGASETTPLQKSVIAKSETTLRFLLGRGANPNARSKYGTALSNAILLGQAELVKILLDAGADPKQEKHGLPSSGWKNAEIAALLKEHGVDGGLSARNATRFLEGNLDPGESIQKMQDMTSKWLEQINQRRIQRKQKD